MQELKLDKWQEEVLKTKGEHNLAIHCSRQLGKSTVISILAAIYAIDHPKKSILIISHTERQAYLLFSKVITYLHDFHKGQIKMGKDRPTKSQLILKNGSIIRCLPTGLDGMGIRGYTIDLLIADEAAMIYEDVWAAVTPMLATTGGKIILLSTPMGASGYFFERCHDPDFMHIQIDAEEVINNRPEPQRTEMLKFREKERGRLTDLQYAQEYEGQFIDEFRRVFPDELLKKCCIAQPQDITQNATYYLGVDIARLGRDYGSYEVLRKYDDGTVYHVYHELSKKFTSDKTHDKIVSLEKMYNFKRIGIDAGSGTLGVGVLDWLLREPVLRSKVEALNNRKRLLDKYGKKTARLMREDMYLNLRAMMERGKIKILDNDEIISALADISFEYPKDTRKSTVQIFAKDHKSTDIAEGLIRAAFLANQKSINIAIHYM